MQSIELRDLHHAYRQGTVRQTVFHGLSHRFDASGSVAILGRSGCGKSTLLNLLAGLERPERGAILVGGQDIGRYGERELAAYRRAYVGIVFQAFNLVPTLNVRDNLRLPLELNRRPRRERERRVDEVLERVGIAGLDGRFPEELSGGEQQRVAVARAIVHQPQLVLADEPTGSLDADNGRRAMELLRDTARAGRHALITVTHSRAVAEYAEQVLVLDANGSLTPFREGIAW